MLQESQDSGGSWCASLCVNVAILTDAVLLLLQESNTVVAGY